LENHPYIFCRGFGPIYGKDRTAVLGRASLRGTAGAGLSATGGGVDNN
jgi:hypothetical protein